jgi:predicted RNase H-like HicB family nuclease
MGERKFTVDIEKGEDGWFVAQCREIPEAMTQGKTIKEAKKNIVEVINLILTERRKKVIDKPIETIEVTV